jgi:hypothetical protein
VESRRERLDEYVHTSELGGPPEGGHVARTSSEKTPWSRV